MKIMKILRMMTGGLLILFGFQKIITDYSEFSVILSILLWCIGLAMIFSAFMYDEWAKEETSETVSNKTEIKAKTKTVHNLNASKGVNLFWFGLVGLLVLVAVMQSAGVIGKPSSSEQAMSEKEFLQALSSANTIEMEGRLRSTDNFTYMSADGVRVGTAKQIGWFDTSWLFMNKGETLLAMSYSDDKPDEEKFTAYAYTGSDSGVLGYAQSDLVDSQEIIYFYNADVEPVGFVNVETAWVGYRDEWTVCDMDGNSVYTVTADYNALNRKLTYTIHKQKESEVNVLQVLGLRFMTGDAISSYYD